MGPDTTEYLNLQVSGSQPGKLGARGSVASDKSQGRTGELQRVREADMVRLKAEG